MERVIFEGKGEDIYKALKDPLINLMLNLSAGLLPENLTEKEVGLLKEGHGDDWFEKLGYTEPGYKKPNF